MGCSCEAPPQILRASAPLAFLGAGVCITRWQLHLRRRQHVAYCGEQQRALVAREAHRIVWYAGVNAIWERYIAWAEECGRFDLKNGNFRLRSKKIAFFISFLLVFKLIFLRF